MRKRRQNRRDEGLLILNSFRDGDRRVIFLIFRERGPVGVAELSEVSFLGDTVKGLRLGR